MKPIDTQHLTHTPEVAECVKLNNSTWKKYELLGLLIFTLWFYQKHAGSQKWIHKSDKLTFPSHKLKVIEIIPWLWAMCSCETYLAMALRQAPPDIFVVPLVLPKFILWIQSISFPKRLQSSLRTFCFPRPEAEKVLTFSWNFFLFKVIEKIPSILSKYKHKTVQYNKLLLSTCLSLMLWLVNRRVRGKEKWGRKV